MKKLVLILALLIISFPAMAETTLEDLKDSKPHAYRVGTTDDIEIEYKIKDAINTKNVKNADKQTNLEGLTYADLSIKKISREISKELEIDNAEMMGDLSMLWQGAATKSDTIKFAIYKLSNPDADKPNDKSVKKVLSTIASMSTLVGAGSGNPLLATGSFFTGSMLSIMGQDTKAMNYKYSKVNDADMIILVRKIDDLQQNIVNKYYDYMTARQVLKRTTKMVNERHNNYKLAQNGKRELVIIADAYYRDSLDIKMKARNEYFSKLAALEKLVVTDVFNLFEQVVNNREK